MTTTPRFTGMRAFLIVWFGQVLSMFGTGMSRIALTLYMFQTTGEATSLALGGFFGFAPGVLLSPVAGALVDRWNRKFAMMVSDLLAGVSTIGLLLVILLAGIDQLQMWHIYLALFVASIGETFQFPAYSSAISTMLNKEQYGRASGLISIAEGTSGIFSPVLGTALYVVIGLQGLFIIDIITFLIAVGCLLLVHIPKPVVSEAGTESRQGGFINEVLYGFRYIFKRPSLLGLQLVFFFINLVGTFAFTVLPAMVLLRTANAIRPNGDEVLLGVVNAAGSVGILLGGVIVSVWGLPKRRVHGVLGGMIFNSLFGVLLMGVARVPALWLLASFFQAGSIPVLNGSNQAIWQAKVPPDIQGRVFGVRRLIAQITSPLAMLIAGPLADKFFTPGMMAGSLAEVASPVSMLMTGPFAKQAFTPAMMDGGALVPIFGGLVGVGPGAGISLMFVIAGVLGIIVGLAGYLFPAVRNAETILPDHAQATAQDV